MCKFKKALVILLATTSLFGCSQAKPGETQLTNTLVASSEVLTSSTQKETTTKKEEQTSSSTKETTSPTSTQETTQPTTQETTLSTTIPQETTQAPTSTQAPVIKETTIATTTQPVKEDLTLDEVVSKVFAGEYGNGQDRVRNIEEKTNYSYNEVQSKVEEIIEANRPKQAERAYTGSASSDNNTQSAASTSYAPLSLYNSDGSYCFSFGTFLDFYTDVSIIQSYIDQNTVPVLGNVFSRDDGSSNYAMFHKWVYWPAQSWYTGQEFLITDSSGTPHRYVINDYYSESYPVKRFNYGKANDAYDGLLDYETIVFQTCNNYYGGDTPMVYFMVPA